MYGARSPNAWSTPVTELRQLEEVMLLMLLLMLTKISAITRARRGPIEFKFIFEDADLVYVSIHRHEAPPPPLLFSW